MIEGVRLTAEALDSGLATGPILFSPERLSSSAAGRALRKRLESIPTAEEIDDRLLGQLSETVTSQGVLAAVAIPPPAPVPASGVVLILDAIADPGNAGTMIRTARAAGAAAVLATKSTTDLWSPKAVRSGMGGHFHTPIQVDLSWDQVRATVGQRQVLLAASKGGLPYWEVDWRQPAAVIIGSEAHGAGPGASALAGERVTIPMAPGAESLNAAAAAAILLFEVRRQTERRVSREPA